MTHLFEEGISDEESNDGHANRRPPPRHFVLLWGPSATSGEPCKLVFLLHVFTFETLQLHLIHRVIAPRRVNSGLGARAGTCP